MATWHRVGAEAELRAQAPLALKIERHRIAIFLQDDAATPGESSLALLPYFPDQAFQTGVDLLMPANDKPDGTITIRNLPRGDEAQPQVIRIPNWASTNHNVSVLFSDFPR